MSSYIVGALPFMSLLFMLFANRTYVMPLFNTDGGHMILGGALVMWTLGFLWMREMNKVTI
jgi:Flp pilus assembly protein TadB